MKKNLLLSLFIAIFSLVLLPNVCNAKEVTVYVFRGETCTYCKKALSFLGTLSEDDNYKDKFKVQSYEVWNNSKNAELMEKAADAMGDTVNGVPYIIIGDETWNGYAESYNEDIKKAIDDTYKNDEFVSKVASILPESQVEESNNNKDIIGIVAVGFIILVLVIATVTFARKGDSGVPSVKELKKKEEAREVEETKVEVEEVKAEKSKTSKKEDKTTKKTSSKSSTTKKTPTKKTTKKKSTTKKTK